MGRKRKARKQGGATTTSNDNNNTHAQGHRKRQKRDDRAPRAVNPEQATTGSLPPAPAEHSSETGADPRRAAPRQMAATTASLLQKQRKEQQTQPQTQPSTNTHPGQPESFYDKSTPAAPSKLAPRCDQYSDLVGSHEDSTPSIVLSVDATQLTATPAWTHPSQEDGPPSPTPALLFEANSQGDESIAKQWVLQTSVVPLYQRHDNAVVLEEDDWDDSEATHVSSPESSPSISRVKSDIGKSVISPGPVDEVHKFPADTKMFYAVRRGRQTGIFWQWEGPGGAHQFVIGFPGACSKKFPTFEEANQFVHHSAAQCSAWCCKAEKERDAKEQQQKEALDMKLCPEQRQLVDLILSGKNVFYTGSAGTGKSTVLRSFVAALERSGKHVVKITPTGISALNIGGQTYHTFAGWTPGSRRKGLEELKRDVHSKDRWFRINETDVLVIDEISMLEADQFERLDQICREARRSTDCLDRPVEFFQNGRSPHSAKLAFGGLQVVVTGDFCQLPPVRPFETCLKCGTEMVSENPIAWICPNCGRQVWKDDKWAFQSAAWESCGFHHFELKTIHRQADQAFIDILKPIRRGRFPTSEQVDLLLNHPCNVEEAVRLFPTNAQADRVNRDELANIQKPQREFFCHDNFQLPTNDSSQLPVPPASLLSKRQLDDKGNLAANKEHRLPAKLRMKVGMLVMLVANINHGAGLVNGRQGQLVSFKGFDMSTLESSDPKSLSYFPASGGEEPEYCNARIAQWIARAPVKKWPVVHFFGDTCSHIIYPRCQFDYLGPERPYSIISRTQLPLLPAWAITIHKSQGMTLDRVIVDLDRSFEREMVYVALSRARSLQGLQVISKNRLDILREPDVLGGGDPAVRKFMQTHFGDV